MFFSVDIKDMCFCTMWILHKLFNQRFVIFKMEVFIRAQNEIYRKTLEIHHKTWSKANKIIGYTNLMYTVLNVGDINIK